MERLTGEPATYGRLSKDIWKVQLRILQI